jgi:hypothetical protein
MTTKAEAMADRPYWWPQPINDEWRASCRADYPEYAEWSDDELDEYFGDGWKYADTWDHLGDARSEYEQLADAFLKLVAETGKSPSDFID